MKARLAYGKTGLEVTLADHLRVETIEPRYVPGVPNVAEVIRTALRQPMASEPLSRLVQSSDTVGIVVNDITRATPYPTILPVLLEEIRHVPDDCVTILVAAGTHRQSTAEELAAMLGPDVAGRFRIVQNDARYRGSHVLAGTTAGGNATPRRHASRVCTAGTER